jgi:hypothetical protein
MKERPIMFSGPSIPMVMAGTKTQTRRIADLERLSVDLPAEVRSDLWDAMPASERRIARKGRHRAKIGDAGAVFAILQGGVILGLKPGEFNLRSPLVDGTSHLADHGNGKKVWTVTPVGEQTLWVRETHAQFAVGNRTGVSPQCVAYRATCDDDGGFDYVNNGDEVMHLKVTKWTPSIFMPRWASRTNLTPIQARLMRLQDITDEDAVAEGVTFTDYGRTGARGVLDAPRTLPGWCYGPSMSYGECFYSARHAFANCWNRLHGGPRWNLEPGPSPWDLNPWVWAYTFRKEA